MIWQYSWIRESWGSYCPAVNSTGVEGFKRSLCRSLGWLQKGSLHPLLASQGIAHLQLSNGSG